MKPLAWISAIAAVLLAGCSPPETSPDRTASGAASGWSRPPAVASATVRNGDLTIVGYAEPGSRVVFRQTSGEAHAVSADREGRYVLPLALGSSPALLRPEVQRGQESAPSPERLLVIGGRWPVIAVLHAGRPTRRLTPGPTLDAVDVSRGSTLLSGRARSDVSVSLTGETKRLAPAEGRWSHLVRTAPPEVFEVEGRRFRWPGDASGTGVAERAGDGWRVAWIDDGGARQTTWLPDA